VSCIEPLEGRLYCHDLFVDLTDWQTEVKSARPPLKVKSQFAPVHPNIFESLSVA
jgi:hypothetical protein